MDFVGIQQWFNTNGSLSRADLQGKVVLVDFWTYSCINCIRTLPYLVDWDEKYRADGLVIVGIHTPEFDFEKDPQNVQKALTKYGITYPVGLDNNYKTWKNYRNSYWPHTYLFNREGTLVFDHIGEGGYDELEAHIQEELAVEEEMTLVATPEFQNIRSPEIYLGAAVNRGNVAYDITPGTHTFATPTKQMLNSVQLGGEWTVSNEYIEAGKDATLRLTYNSRDIHVVAGGSGTIQSTVDDAQPTTQAIDRFQLYTLANTSYEQHTIDMQVSPGVLLYTFTFG